MYDIQSVIDIARSQVGFHEKRDSSGWTNVQKYSEQLPGFKWSDGQPWCATFAFWCLWQTGIAVPAGAVSASCATSVKAFKKVKRFTEYPITGGLVFFGAADGGKHMGIVTGWDLQHVRTIEGNTNTNGSPEGDGVYFKEHERRIDYVYGYGIPYYPHDVGQSPDEVWRGRLLAK